MRVTKDHNNSNKNRVQIKKKKGDKQLRHKSTSVAIVVVPVVPVVVIVIIWSLLLLCCCCCWWYYWFWVNNRITCTYVSSIHICTQSLSHIPPHTHTPRLTHTQTITHKTHAYSHITRTLPFYEWWLRSASDERQEMELWELVYLWASQDFVIAH